MPGATKHCLSCDKLFTTKGNQYNHQRFCDAGCRKDWHKLSYDDQYKRAGIYHDKYEQHLTISKEANIQYYLITDTCCNNRPNHGVV
jgi:hypothetical protein